MIAIVAICALAILTLAHTTGRHWIPQIVSIFTTWLPDKIGVKLERMFFSALEGIAGVFRPSNAFGFLLLTGFIWILEVIIVYIVAVSVGLPLALGNALLVLLVLAIGSMVPSSPGQVGTFELVGLVALALVSLQGPLAFAFIILLHLITLICSTTIGVVCILVRKTSPLFPKSMPSP